MDAHMDRATRSDGPKAATVILMVSLLLGSLLAGETLLMTLASRADARVDAAGGALTRLTPAWEFPDGWEITAWSADHDASMAAAVRSTERVTTPRPGWRARDLYVLNSPEASPVYGPESGIGTDPIHRAQPSVSADGSAAAFATYRQDYPQGSDVRLWRAGRGQHVVFQSGLNFDVDFARLAADGRSGFVVEILPLTADNHVFRMRIHRWTDDGQSTMLVEHQNRHVTGLDLSADGRVAAYCLQNHAEHPVRGEIRLVDIEGSGRTIFHFLGVGGPVAVSADGSIVAAFLPGTPEELGGPGSDDPGIYLWRESGEPRRIDEPGTAPDSRIPLTLSADGSRVSWRGQVWEESTGVVSILPDEADAGSSEARMSRDGRNWTLWLPDGPEGPGLYRYGPGGERMLFLPLITNGQ